MAVVVLMYKTAHMYMRAILSLNVPNVSPDFQTIHAVQKWQNSAHFIFYSVAMIYQRPIF